LNLWSRSNKNNISILLQVKLAQVKNLPAYQSIMLATDRINLL